MSTASALFLIANGLWCTLPNASIAAQFLGEGDGPCFFFPCVFCNSFLGLLKGDNFLILRTQST